MGTLVVKHLKIAEHNMTLSVKIDISHNNPLQRMKASGRGVIWGNFSPKVCCLFMPNEEVFTRTLKRGYFPFWNPKLGLGGGAALLI